MKKYLLFVFLLLAISGVSMAKNVSDRRPAKKIHHHYHRHYYQHHYHHHHSHKAKHHYRNRY